MTGAVEARGALSITFYLLVYLFVQEHSALHSCYETYILKKIDFENFEMGILHDSWISYFYILKAMAAF